ERRALHHLVVHRVGGAFGQLPHGVGRSLPAGGNPRPGECDGGGKDRQEVQRPRRAAAPEAGRRHSGLRASAAETRMPASYSATMGMASISCEITSGGVITAAITKTPTMA